MSEVLRDANCLLSLMNPAQAPAFLAAKVESERSLTDFEIELRWNHADGWERLIHLQSRPRRDAQGRVLWDGFAQDITERKQAEIALREREQQLQLFVEHSPAAIAMLDTNMCYLVASHRWLSDFRLGEQTIVGRSHYEVFPDLPEHWKEIHRRCLAGAIEKNEAEEFRRADGSVDWVRWEIRPWRTGEGRIGGVIIFSELITERKRTEEALRLQNAAVEAAANAIVISDCSGTIQWANAAFTAMTGYTREEVIGQSTRLLKSGKHDAAFYRQLWDTVMAGKVWRSEMINRHKDGHLYTEEATITPVPGSTGRNPSLHRRQAGYHRAETRRI